MGPAGGGGGVGGMGEGAGQGEELVGHTTAHVHYLWVRAPHSSAGLPVCQTGSDAFEQGVRSHHCSLLIFLRRRCGVTAVWCSRLAAVRLSVSAAAAAAAAGQCTAGSNGPSSTTTSRSGSSGRTSSSRMQQQHQQQLKGAMMSWDYWASVAASCSSSSSSSRTTSITRNYTGATACSSSSWRVGAAPVRRVR